MQWGEGFLLRLSTVHSHAVGSLTVSSCPADTAVFKNEMGVS